MKVVQVKTKPVSKYIPLKGWDSVATAVSTFAEGFTKDAKSTEDKLTQTIGEDHGGIGVGMFLLATTMVNKNSKLVEKMLSEAKAKLKHDDEWSRHYDYDGIGTPFLKTSVNIIVIDRAQDMFGLSIYAAYVGDQPEQGLAEHLDIPRALVFCSVIAETEILTNNRFGFDFEVILRKLDNVLGTEKISCTEVIEHMKKVDEETKPVFIIKKMEDLEVTLCPAQVERRFVYGNDHNKRDTWRFDNTTLYGELNKSYGDPGKKEPPSFAVTLANSQSKEGCSYKTNLPIWQPEKKKVVLDLANRIAEALQ